MRIHVVALSIVVALLAWSFALVAAFSIPGSPFHAVPQVVERLNDARTAPAAFSEFLRLGERTQLVAATVFPLVAALAVVGLSRWQFKLSRRESVIVVLLFGVFALLWSGGLSYFSFLDLLSIAIFAAVVIALGVPRHGRLHNAA